MSIIEKEERLFRGVAASPGVAIGDILPVHTEEKHITERHIQEDEIPREIARFEDALITTHQQLQDIQQQVSDVIGQKNASIFDAHMLVVSDRSFVEEVIRQLHAEQLNVEAVLQKVSDRYANALSKVNDDYLRERAVDVKDVARRILRNLSGETTSLIKDMEKQAVVVSNDLTPSDTATLDRDKVIAFATDLGSRTSHTAIMARALDIPAVVGLHDLSMQVTLDDKILVDGNKGLVYLNPTPARLEHYGEIVATQLTIRSDLNTLADELAETLDGYRVTLSANIEFPEDAAGVQQRGSCGVGLFRSEFLYLTMDHLPSEEEQFAAYNSVAQQLAPDPVIIRSLDLGGDKFLAHTKTPEEMNPFMGWRAIRFCLAQPEIFKTQLRAILRAGVHGNVKLMYPMVSNVGEVLSANKILEEAREELRQTGTPFNEDMDVGVMIEVPSAALTAHVIAPHVSFFSIGTNDLIQYTLAVDRVNENIAHLYEPTHPAIIRLIKNTIDVGHEHDVWTGVCGEMAGNILMVPLLLGLGADELSVSPVLVPLVKKMVRSLRFSQAEELAIAALASESATDVLESCRLLVEKTAPELLEFVG